MKKLMPLALIAICLCSTETSAEKIPIHPIPPRVGQAPLYDASGARVGTVRICWEVDRGPLRRWTLSARIILWRAEKETSYAGAVQLYGPGGNQSVRVTVVLDTNRGGSGMATGARFGDTAAPTPVAFDCQLVSKTTGATIASDLTAF